LRGVVFVVDASTSEWSDSAEYLHDVLLALQKLQQSKKTSDNMFRVLVACNKADLFTALPAAKIKVLLGEEVGKVREAKSRGIVGMGNEDRDDAEDEWLGIVGSRKQFEFKELEEVGIEVEFAGGSTANGKSWKATLETWFGGAL
jgi:signal recognition particle receptor subunit beta